MTLPLPNYRSDDDAEHSLSFSILGEALAPEVDESLNVGLVSIYAVVHDLVEVYAGDTSVWSAKEQLGSKKEREEAALKHLFGYIRKYETLDTNEARFMYALNKSLNMLTIVEDNSYYYKRNI